MKWRLAMANIIRMIMGLPESKKEGKTQNYDIRPKMRNPDLVVMDYKSFRASSKVQAQAKAAKNSTRV